MRIDKLAKMMVGVENVVVEGVEFATSTQASRRALGMARDRTR